MSALIRVPKKLEIGMTVVFREINMPWKRWKKAVINNYDSANKCYVIAGKLDDKLLFIDKYIIIRSVALTDNKTEAYQRELARARDKYREKTRALAELKAAVRRQH